MRSDRLKSSSSPTGCSSETVSWLIRWISRTRSIGNSTRWATSSAVGSRPSSCRSWRWAQTTLLIVSTMWTGMRIVRAWSAIARVMAWRIHQVA